MSQTTNKTTSSTAQPDSSKPFEWDYQYCFAVRLQTPRVAPMRLDDWNREHKAYWDAVRDRHNNPQNYPNGLTCPKCDGNLYDTLQVASVSPTMLRVRCTFCQFSGERYE